MRELRAFTTATDFVNFQVDFSISKLEIELDRNGVPFIILDFQIFGAKPESNFWFMKK
jgi:hypothetical protein